MFDRKLFTALASNPANDAEASPSLPPVFPLPVINGQPPVLLVFDHASLAVEVAYEKHHLPGGPLVRGSTRETTLYCIPRLTPVHVVSDGSVIDARKQPNGDHRVVVDHGNGWLTVYGGLAHMLVQSTVGARRCPMKVQAGDILGYLTATRAGPLRALQFELWRENRLQDYDQIDPIRHMRRWHQLDWKDHKDHGSRVA